MKLSKAFQIWTKCVENKWEGNQVPLGEGKLECTLTINKLNYQVFPMKTSKAFQI